MFRGQVFIYGVMVVMRIRNKFFSLSLAGFLLFNTFVATLPVAAQDAEEPPDLPAMTLRTWDIAEAGFSQELYSYGAQCGNVGHLATYLAVRSNLDKSETIEAFNDAGMLLYCHQSYAELEDPDAESRTLVSVISSSVNHYASERGARNALRTLAGSDDNPYAEPIPEGKEYSRQSHAQLFRLADSVGDYLQLELTFRVDNIIGTVSIRNYSDEAPAYTEAFEALADILTAKIETVLDGESPGFGPLIVRVEDGTRLPSANYSYHVFDGKAEPFASETPEIFQQRLDTYGDASYVLTSSVLIAATVSGATSDVQMTNQLLQLEDEDAASEWIDNYLEQQEANPAVFDLLVRDNAPAYGDESLTLLWGAEAGAVERIVGRVGDVVFNVGFYGERLPPEGTEIIAMAQVECLEHRECDDPLSVADVFAEPDADDEDTPDTDTGDDEEDGDEAGNDSATGETYESELYPYTLTYDDSWSLDDPTIVGDTEILTMTNGASNVVLVAGTSHQGDVASCLDAAIDYIADNDENSDMETVLDENGDPVEGDDDDRAYTALRYITSDDVELIVHIECRVLVPGESTIEFDQYVLASAYEDEEAAREQLLDGLEIDEA